MINTEDKNKLNYLKLKEQRNQALANFINTLSNKQFVLYTRYIRFEEKLRKQDLINLVNNIIKNK